MFLDLDAQNKSADRLDHHALHNVIHDDSFNRLEISRLECTYSPAAIILIEIHSSSQNLTMCYFYTVKLFILATSLISLSVCSDSDVVWRYTNTQRHGGRTSTRDLLRLEAVTTASQDESLSDSDFVWSAPTCSLSSASGRVRLCFFIHLRRGMAAKVK